MLKIKSGDFELELVTNNLFNDYSADANYKDLQPNIKKLIDELTEKFSKST